MYTLILVEEDYNKWVNGEIKVENPYGELITQDDWYDDYLEGYITKYTSFSGDKIVVLCKRVWV